MAQGSIKKKTVDGFKWGIIDNFANSGITFLVGLVLARLLSPDEFGVLGIITIFINLSITIIDGGFATALIRKPDTTDADYNTVFYTNLLVSIVLMLLLVVGSPAIASFFHQPILGQALPVMSIVLLVNAVGVIQKTLLVKRLDFRSQAYVSLLTSLLSGSIGICMAVYGYGIWSLVGQQLSRQVFMMVGLWLINDWRPRLCFSIASFHDLFGFGSKLLAASLINSFYRDVFLAVIGKIFSARDLGYYNRADQFNLIFSNNLGQIVQKISLSSLSLLQDDPVRFRSSFRKLMLHVAMFSFAMVFGMSAAAKPLLMVLIGEKWLPSVYYLQIMSLYAAIYPLQMLNLNVLSICKHSDYMLKLEILKKMLFIPVIAVGFMFELQWMIWAAVVYYYVEFFLNGWYSKRLLGYSTFEQVRDLAPIYLVSMIVSVVVWMITLLPIPYLLMLVLQVIAATVLYVCIYSVLKQPEFLEIRNWAFKKLFDRVIV